MLLFGFESVAEIGSMGGICSTSVGDHNPSLFADYLKRDEEDSGFGGSMSDVYDPSDRVRVQGCYSVLS